MAFDIDVYLENISRIRKSYRILIFFGTIILLVGLYIWFIYIPKTDEIARIKSSITSLEQRIALARIKAKNLKKLEADYQNGLAELEFALKLLPTTSEIPSLLRNITKLGNDSNLDFILFSPKKEVEKQFYAEIPVSIEVRGGYHDVAMFFDRIGKLDRIVNIINVAMRPVKANETILNTSCTALTYRFIEQSEIQNAKKKKK